jgi:hydroxypyruvate isomerase
MPKLAANLSYLFTEMPLIERFGAAASVGFRGVEILNPYELEPGAIAAELRKHGLTQVLLNTPAGDAAKGERGLAALPGRGTDFMASFERTLAYARATQCKRLHVLAGVPPNDRPRTEAEETYVANLRRAADGVANDGITLQLEPLNTRDAPGYFINTTGDTLRLIERIDRSNVALQFDLYHCQIMEGDLAAHVHALKGRFTHVQIAGVPGRHEPDVGEINYPYLLGLLDETGYQGWVSAEYRPRNGTLAGLGWARPWGITTK